MTVFYSVYVQGCAGYSTKSRIICTTMGHGTMFSVTGFQIYDNLLVNKMVPGISTDSFVVMLEVFLGAFHGNVFRKCNCVNRSPGAQFATRYIFNLEHASRSRCSKL